jgi:hypothetical protein
MMWIIGTRMKAAVMRRERWCAEALLHGSQDGAVLA